MNLHHALVLLTTETALHAGTGQSIAGLDLPIQREVHTTWPCILGSSVKGALRAHAEIRAGVSKDLVTTLFGPSHDAASERDTSHAGSLMIGDAKILLLPVRSLQSNFKWVTSPSVLRRFFRDGARLQTQITAHEFVIDNIDQALGSAEQKIFLEEFRLTQLNKQQVEFNELCKLLIELTGGEKESRLTDLHKQLIIVHDDVFTYLAKNATSVNAHIAIDSETKLVRPGALWYEESLPSDSILYFPLTATSSRKQNHTLSAIDAIQVFQQEIFTGANCWLQIGGNETTGMGWCRLDITTTDGVGA